MPALRYHLYRDTGRVQVCSTERGDWQVRRGDRAIRTSSPPSDESHRPCFAGYPDLHIIAVTDHCNHRCTYCQASAKPGDGEAANVDLDDEQLDRIVHFVLRNSNDRLTVEFQGGEPLLNFGAVEYLADRLQETSRQQRKKIRFSIATNLTILSEETAGYLARRSFNVSTSLDGLPALHNPNRKLAGGGDSYSRVMAGASLLSRHTGLPGVIVVVTGKSLPYPEAIVDSLVRQRLYGFFLKAVYPIGYAKRAWTRIGIEPSEYGRFWRRAMEKCLEYNSAGYPVMDRTFAILLRKILLGQNPCYVDLNSPCGAVHGQIAYDLEGNIYPCDEGRFGQGLVIGHVATSTFEDVSQHPLSVEFRETSRTSESHCGLCPYRPWCGRCPAMAYHEHGPLDLPSSDYFYCRLMKAVFDAFFELLAERPDQLEVASRIVNLSDFFRFHLRS